MKPVSTIVISQTGTLLDVFFTLPLAYVMRQHKENQCKIVLVADEQARPLGVACQWIDVFLSKDSVLADFTLLQQYQPQVFMAANNDISIIKLASKMNIPVRVGDRKYWRNWLNCNKLVDISILKGKKIRHQIQRTIALAAAFKANIYFSAEMLSGMVGLTKIEPLPQFVSDKISDKKFNLILQLSNPISSLQWPIEKFILLCQNIDSENFNVILIAEKHYQLPDLPLFVHNLTGTLSFVDTMSLIAAVDGIVATNTVELHIASSFKKYALGLFNNMWPYTLGNQRPSGNNASVFIEDKHCNKCQNGASCQCLQRLSEQKILAIIQQWPHLRQSTNKPISSNTP